MICRSTSYAVINGNLEFGMGWGEPAHQGPVNVFKIVYNSVCEILCENVHNCLYKIVCNFVCKIVREIIHEIISNFACEIVHNFNYLQIVSSLALDILGIVAKMQWTSICKSYTTWFFHNGGL